MIENSRSASRKGPRAADRPLRTVLTACVAAGALLAVAGCSTAVASSDAPTVAITADQDRDGKVDPVRPASAQRPDGARALVLPNIGVSDGQCQGVDSALSDDELEACHDASDDVAHAPQNLAPVQVAAVTGASSSATGTVRVEGDPRGLVRVFRKTDKGWTLLPSDARLEASDLQKGLELGVDSRDIIRDRAVWDGNFSVRVDVVDGGRTTSASVPMAVAPLVFHNHTQRATQVFVPRSGQRQDHQQFVKGVQDVATSAGAKLTTLATEDNWAQDVVEFAQLSIPGPDGTVRSIEVAVRSPQPARVGGRAVFGLRGPGFGAIQTGGKGYHQVSSFGNLEVIPPYEHDGHRFPAGRIIYGDGGRGSAFQQSALTLFSSQGVQEPLQLDTSWLAIGHVDEFVQFLPASNERGWTIAIADPRRGVEVLRSIRDAGHGTTRASSNPQGDTRTVAEVLADQRFLDGNEEVAQMVDRNLEVLLQETGVRAEEVVRIPQLFRNEAGGFSADWAAAGPGAEAGAAAEAAAGAGAVPPDSAGSGPFGGPADGVVHDPSRPFDAAKAVDGPIEYGDGAAGAYLPGAINGLLIDRDHYVVPKQWGPVVDGRDAFQSAVDSAYRDAGITAISLDDYTTHHQMGGEVHCGSNAVREVTTRWWATT